MIEVKGYTSEELNYIKDNYENKTVKELSKELNRSCSSISYVCRRLGLIKQIHHDWTNEEIEFLKEHYIDMTSEEISKYVNHTVDGINGQRDRLCLLRHETWSDYEIEFLKSNYNKMLHEEIGKILGRSRGAITAKCFDLDLYKKDLPWNHDEIKFLCENYSKIPTVDIANFLNRTPVAIKVKADRIGLKKYPYYCDYNYFDNIDTEEKAYWLGFLTADGWIYKNHITKSGVTGVELQYGDIDHLKKLNKSLDSNYRITGRWRPCLLSMDKNKKNHMCILRIFSLIMYNSMINIGFTNNKSFDCNIPNLRYDLIRHFVRGYFDGNGCFTFTDKSFSIGFVTASKLMNDSLIDILNKNGFKFKENSIVTEYGTTVYKPFIYKRNDKIGFLDWIYKDSHVYLDRKYNKYLRVKEFVDFY